MMIWKIYYATGATVSSDDSTWEAAPCDGVIAICVSDNVYGKVVLNGKDFYYKVVDGAENDLYGTNDLGPQLAHRRDIGLPADMRDGMWCKFGVGIASKKFKEIVVQACNDPDFPRSQRPMRRTTDRER